MEAAGEAKPAFGSRTSAEGAETVAGSTKTPPPASSKLFSSKNTGKSTTVEERLAVLEESPRELPANVEERITKLYPDKPLPAEVGELPQFAGTHPLSGRIYVNGPVWDAATKGQRARLYFEELSHQTRTLRRPSFLRAGRAKTIGFFESLKFVDEFLAGRYAMRSTKSGFYHAWNYPDINVPQATTEIAAATILAISYVGSLLARNKKSEK